MNPDWNFEEPDDLDFCDMCGYDHDPEEDCPEADDPDDLWDLLMEDDIS